MTKAVLFCFQLHISVLELTDMQNESTKYLTLKTPHILSYTGPLFPYIVPIYLGPNATSSFLV